MQHIFRWLTGNEAAFDAASNVLTFFLPIYRAVQPFPIVSADTIREKLKSSLIVLTPYGLQKQRLWIMYNRLGIFELSDESSAETHSSAQTHGVPSVFEMNIALSIIQLLRKSYLKIHNYSA